MQNYAKKLRSVFLVGFLLTIALSLTGYLDSSFLGNYVNIQTVGILFSIGSLVSIIFLSYLPKILAKTGITGVFHITSFMYLLSILGMLNTGIPFLFETLFVFYIASGIGIYYAIDVLIEHFSANQSTGKTRGFYLSIYNLAYLLGPLFAGVLLRNNSFELVYLMAGIFIIIMFLLYIRDLEDIKFEPRGKQTSFIRNLLKLLREKDVLRVYFISLMLSFFFSWMAIYTPIYLNQFLGFSWSSIGALFAIMHIPYVSLEIPIGRLADRYQCEREIISLGLIFIAISTATISLIPGANFWLWAIALFATRIGASFVQVGTESYFFKKVSDKDSGMIAMFRNASPIAYILGPVVATICLSFTTYNNLFIILGGIMFSILFVSISIKNIKNG